MSKHTYHEGDEGVELIVNETYPHYVEGRSPIHVVYGGADRYTADTARKLGSLAVRAMDTYATNFVEFAQAMDLPGAANLSSGSAAIDELEKRFADESHENETVLPDDPAHFCWRVYRRTFEKLRHEAVEDFRIDFEDGYGFRPDDEEDGHARSAATELAMAFREGTITPFCGFRIKSLGPETSKRGERTLRIFFETLIEKTEGRVPENFVINLPKITNRDEVRHFVKLIEKLEDAANLPHGSIGVELMIETPEAIFDYKGRLAIPRIVKEARGRCRSLHFGVYDYTASLGIAAEHQSLHHPAADLARQFMLLAAAPVGLRVSDSVTAQLPLPMHRGDELTDEQLEANRRAVHDGWRVHFRNVRRSMANGFYQGWDLHPNQLPARYAAVYSFFLEGFDRQAARTRTFIERATQASLTGNTFDDAASARGLVNFFSRGMSCGAFTDEEVITATGKDLASIPSMFAPE